MNLDEEFEKMYGGSGAASAAPDLEAEFAKLYGGEPKPKFDLDAQSGAGELPDWQRKRISEDDDAERGYNYVMENRGKRQSEPENPETQTRLDQAIRSDGTEYGRKAGEDFMTWAKRNKIHVNQKNHDGWMDYYRFEAPDMPEFPEVSPGIVDYKKMGDNVVAAAQEKQRVEMEAKNASAKRRREFIDELEKKGIKEGSFVQFVGKDGETENRFYNGLNEDGRPVFSVAHGKLSKMTSKYKLDLDKFRDLMDEGNAKREDNPLESVRRGVAAEEGRDVGVGEAVATRAAPFVGRAMRDTAVEQMKNLSKLHEGDLSYDEVVPSTVPSIAGGGALPQTQTRRLGGVEAVERMAKSIWNDSEALRAEGEDEDAYIARVRERATGELKNRVAIQQKAGREEAQVEQGAVDKIVKGGVDSAGYALEFTIAGLPFAPLGPVGAMAGSSAIETAASAPSRQLDLTTPSWALDENGNLVKTSRAMDEDQAKWQAIVGAAAENVTEVALEAATLGTLRFAGGWLRKGAKAVAPKGLGAAEAKVAEFMQSDTGLKLMSIGKHYRQFSDRTQINAPWSELAEEHVQRYFDDVVGLGKKPDDYKGFDKESAAFWNDMKSLSYHADTLYGLLGQLAVGGAHAGLAASREVFNREKVDDEVVNALKRAGISDEAINSLDLEQRVSLCDLWARSKGKPETIKKEIDALDFAVRNVARRALADEAEVARKTVEERGETLATFNIPVSIGKNGKQTVQFEQIGIRDTWTGQETSVRAVLDRQNGVGIVDRGDGLYEAVDTMGGSQVCDSIDDAINAAKDLAVTAQQRKSDREIKKAVIENERANNYGKKNVVYFNTIGDAATQIGEEIAQNGEAYGMSDISQLRDPKNVSRAGFHTADGTTVVILDNVRSPNDIPRLLGHEIIGHGGANGEFGNSQGSDEFAGKIRSDDFDSFKEASAQKHQSVTAGETIEQAREAVNANLHEVFAHYAADAERGKPSAFDRLAYAVNIAARKIGLKKTYSDADVRVLLNKWRESVKGTGGRTAGSNAERFSFFDVEQPTAPAETHENAPVSAPSEKGTTSRPNETASAQGEESGKSEVSEEEPPTQTVVGRNGSQIETVEQPIDELSLSEDVPQFKEGADKNGIVEKLKAKKYERRGTAPILVWVRNNGKKEVISGRHRFFLAKELGEQTIPAQLLYERDGITREVAMTLDAESNIRDGQGSIKDYENYFRNSDIDEDEASGRGLLSRDKGRKGFAIAKWASPDVVAAFHAGEINPEKAAAIATEGKGDESLQNVGLKFAQNHTVSETVSRMKNVKGLAQAGLKGESGAVQGDFFMNTDFQRTADAIDKVSRQLESAVNSELTALKGAKKLGTEQRQKILSKYGIKAGDTKAITERIDELEKFKTAFDRRESDPSMMNLLRKKAGIEVADGAPVAKDPTAANDLSLESATQDELNAEAKKRRQKVEIERKQNAPLKGGSGETGQTLMDLGGAEGEDLFNRTQMSEGKRTGKKSKEAVSKTETTTPATPKKALEVEKPVKTPVRSQEKPAKPAKVEKGKFKSVEEAEKAAKERADLAALFDSPEFDPNSPVHNLIAPGESNVSTEVLNRRREALNQKMRRDGLRFNPGEVSVAYSFANNETIVFRVRNRYACDIIRIEPLSDGFHDSIGDFYDGKEIVETTQELDRNAEENRHSERFDHRTDDALQKRAGGRVAVPVASRFGREGSREDQRKGGIAGGEVPGEVSENHNNLEDTPSEAKPKRESDYAPRKTRRMFKLFRKYPDGTYGALFIDSANRLKPGVWYKAKSPTIGKLRSLDGAVRSDKFKWGRVYLLDGNDNAVSVDKMPSVNELNDATKAGKRYMTVTFGSNGKKLFYNLGINGSGSVAGFAFRPGWHSTNAPSAAHIGRSYGMKGKVSATGQNHYRNPDEVWCEIEIPDVIDYNKSALDRAPMLKDGKTKNRKEAQLDHIPVDGNYFYRTNSNADEKQDWVITGAVKIVRELPREEVNRFNRENGFLPDAPLAGSKEEAMQKQNASPNNVDWSSDEFDPEMFQKRVGAMSVIAKRYVDNGIGTFEEIVADLQKDFPDKFDSMKPFLAPIWNMVARGMKLPSVSEEQEKRIFARIEKPSEKEPTVEKPTEKALTKGERISNAADELVALIEKGEKFDRRTLEETVAKHLGGSVAEGTFTPKDASDILELAVNRVVLNNDDIARMFNSGDVQFAKNAIKLIRDKILSVIPTQTVRSDEQIKMQQFSTPPHEAFAVNWVANIRPNDVALEPSAGIGGIAVFAKASGARKIVANELSDRRREILKELGIADNLYGVDAAKIWQHLFWEVNKGNAERPTVVVMNPPFSSSVVSGRHSTIGVGGAHIEAALDSLAQGGRLVAVVGNGMSYDSPSTSAAAWWKKIGSKYRVMANVRVNGNEYAKYGTDFDNNIIVIDKVEPDPTVKPVFGKIESLDEFPALMEGVRNARPGSNQQTESASDKQGGRGGNETRAAGLVSVGNTERSDIRPGDSRSDAGVVGGRGGENPGRAGSGDKGLDRTGETSRNVRGGNKNTSGSSGRNGISDRRDRLDNGRSLRNGIGEAGGRADADSELLASRGLKSENPQGGSEEVRTVGDGTFAEYRPSKLNIPGMKPHPGEIVESAAMASVKTPDITYSPRIPKELVEKGQPSAAQLEVITLAGQSHEQILPNGQRRGFFTQDGTGMGKGTELSGIICDNFNHGRRKAIWISKNEDLFADAKRDLSTYGLEKDAFLFGKKKTYGNIAFLSYNSLTTGSAFDDKGGVTNMQGERSKLLDLVNWFGKDYDGVVIFDESHMMANVEGKQSSRGTSEGSKQAKMAVKLQELLPNARVVYASATGATEVGHLACLPRLGLWGEGTSFKTKGEFIEKISKGGLSMMEMVARDMKAAGLTLSRSLTMEGIVNRTLKHNLSPDQTRRYNECAAAWQDVYDNILDVIASTGEIHNGKRVGNVIGQMKTAQQNFFNSLLTSMMLPSVIADMKRNLADGKSIVVQLTQTNESATKKAIAKNKDPNFDPENIDTSPREILRGYVSRYFPTQVYTEIESEDGKKSWVVAKDSNGKPLEDPAAVERKNEILDKIDMMRMDGSPLDAILEEFGYNNVAEVTGRTKRIERVERDGEMKSVIASRSKNRQGKAEAEEFNAGKRRILIFSEAGGTGKSYHASRTYENQQQRIHYLLQAGWSAPPAIQGLGRTNRTNQASKPEYVLCTTDVKGHLRFVSSVARRLQQMGSLTSGDRSTAGNGVFNEDQNIEDRYSEMALKNIFRDLYYNNREEFNRVCNIFGYIRPKVDTETGERTNKNLMLDPETGELRDEEIPTVTKFLNTMLHLRIDDMNRFFDQFMQTRNDLIETAKQNGKYDPGLEKLIAEKIVEKSRTPIYEDPATGSKTEVVELGVSHKSRKRSYETVEKMMEDARRAKRRAFFATNKQSGMLYSFVETPYTETDDKGVVHAKFYRFAPDGTSNILRDSEVRIEDDGNYTPIEDGEAAWRAEYAKVPDLIEGNNYYVTGAILPVFGRLGIEDPRVKRIEPTGKKTSFLGLEIPNSMVDQVMANFGEGDASAANSPGTVYRRIVNDGKGVDLQRDGWKLRRARVNYDTAIELVGLEGPEEARRLEQLGYGRFDRSSGKPRFFIPRTEAGVAKFLADYPVKVDGAPQVFFDSPEFDPEAEEKTFGITNEDEKFMLEAASMPVPKHVTKADDVLMVQAEHLLSNRDFMRKLAHAVAQKARPTSDAQNVALGIYSEQCADALNAAKQAYDDMVAELELLPPDADQETVDVTKKSIAALRKELAGARRDFREAAMAKRAGASEQGRALRTNRFLFSTADYSYAGLRGIVQSEIGKSEIPEEMDAEIGKLAGNFKDLDERSRKMAVERLKLFAQKVVNDLKAGGRKASSSGPKAAGNELKRVMRNYEDALNQVQVHADEAGGTLIGMADQLYPSWGKWLKAIGEYHCFMNPDITEQEVIDAIRADLGRYLTDGIDEETVRDVLTGFGHNYRQSRYDSQRKMNDLKAQALSKRQRDYMIENGKLPPQTGMVRDEPSDETRALRKEVQQIKKDIDEQEGGPRALKGALASAKTRVRNTIADLENAIARGERIERSHRTLMEDAELQQLKKRRDELREEYEAMFGEKSALTDEQRLQRAEKMLRKTLERALERLGRAYGGDFSTATRVRLDNATTMQLREEIANTNKIIRDLKDAAYPMGTPEEIAKRNANRMKRREEAIQRLQARIISGDIRPQAKPVPPMPPDMQKQYDALGDQMKAAHRRLQQLREEARHATWFAVPRAALDGFNYVVGSVMSNAASYDRSAVLRQALRLSAAKPVEAAKAYAKAEKAAWDEDYFNEVNDKLLADPIIDEGMEKYGLRLHSTDIEHIHTIELFKTPNTVEPRIVTRIGQMIGGIPVIGKIGKKAYGAHTYIKAGSERHYVTYLNLMAGQTYKLLVDAVPGGASDFQKRKFAGLVNILTGAASMPENFRHGINVANTIGGNVAPVIWSPSLWMSQIQQVGLADVWGAYIGKKDDVKPGANAYAEATYVAKEAMKLRIRAGLAIAALGALLSYALGDDDWWNELVADARRGNLWRVWNKIHHPVIGKTHIDLEMGERTFSKTIGAFVTTKTETSTGRTKELGSYGTGDWYSMLGRYAGGKISPMYSAIIALRFGRDYVGNPYGFKEFASSWIPLSVGDVFQSAMEDSWLDGTAPVAVALTMLGAGGSVYDEKYYERTVNPFLESVKDIEKTVSDPLLDREEKDLIVKNIREAAGGIFSDDRKWREAYGLARQISAADGKLKKSIKQFETAQASGRKFDETSAVKNIEKATGALDAQKRRLMEMIQQGKDNYLRPWRR